MPQRGGTTQMGQDWDSVNVGRSTITKKNVVPKSAREVSAAKASGLLTTEKRYGAGGNKSAHTNGASGMSAKKLEEADEAGTIVKVDKSLSKAIMQARTAKKLTQKDLATSINEKPQVVAEYESGKAIPNAQIISKIERKLGVKLPRPGKAIKAPPKAGSGGGGGGGTGGGVRNTGGGGGGGARMPVAGSGPPKRR